MVIWKAKLKFMKNETVEGADLAFELVQKYWQIPQKNFPLCIVLWKHMFKQKNKS